MQGRKPDEDLREPMRWYRDPHHADENRWKSLNPADGAEVSVEAEQQDKASLLNFYSEMIDWRRQVSALRVGALHSVPMAQDGLVAWQLDAAGSHGLIVHNLSASTHSVELGSATPRRYSHVLRSTQPGAR